MSAKFAVIKGKVVVEGHLGAEDSAALQAKYKSTQVFELRRLKHADLAFLKSFDGLRELSLVNVKVDEASALASLGKLHKLLLNGVTVRAGFSFLEQLEQIGELHLLNQPGELCLPDLGGLASLTKFRVWGCKRFSDVFILRGAPKLEEVEFIDTALGPDDLRVLFEKTSIKYINARFRTKRDNEVFSRYLTEFGKSQYRDPGDRAAP